MLIGDFQNVLPVQRLEGNNVILEAADVDRHLQPLWSAQTNYKLSGTEDDLIFTYLKYGPFSKIEDFADHLKKQIETDRQYHYAVKYKADIFADDGESLVVGSICYMEVVPEDRKCEIGNIWLDPSYRQKNIMDEAVYSQETVKVMRSMQKVVREMTLKKFIIYFVRQVNLYRKCENVENIKDDETISYRVITEVVSQAMIAECFFESAPQALLQMYVLATQFGRIRDSQQRLRFSITIVVMISSMLELGLTVGGRWVDNLVAHPVMELRPDLMKFLLYTESISFLLVRSTLICGTILVLRALLHSGLYATLIVMVFLLLPRIIAMIVRILTRIPNVQGEGMGDYIRQLVSRVVATILFYPVLHYQWTLIYIECETVFLGLSCIFVYYGEYGVKAEIELFNGVQKGLGRGLIYGLCLLYILNIALRWTRVIYLLRIKNTIPENTAFTVYKYCQSITNTLYDFETKNEETEAKKFKLRQINCELGNLVRYFEKNFGDILTEAGQQQLCLCQYSKYLNRLYLNEQQRRGNSISKFRPAENQGSCQLGDTLLYAEMIDLTLLRLHTFAVFGVEHGEKVDICRGSKWVIYRDLLGRLLCYWRLVHLPRCPQQFLSRCPTFKFLDFKLLLDMGKANKLFGKVAAPYILWNAKLGRCSECEIVELVTLFSN